MRLRREVAHNVNQMSSVSASRESLSQLSKLLLSTRNRNDDSACKFVRIRENVSNQLENQFQKSFIYLR